MTTKGQPRHSWLPSASFNRPKTAGRRAHKFNLKIYKLRILVSARKFRTNKARRTKVSRQFVFSAPVLGYKEVAITLKSRRRKTTSAPVWLLSKAAMSVLVALGIAGSLYFGLNLNTPRQITPSVKAYTSSAVQSAPKPYVLPPSMPTAITIEKIDLSTQLVPVDLNPDSTLQVPSDPSVAGWYNKSPTPGEMGASVIDGHLDKVNGIAVFWRLRELAPGDTVDIARADGQTAHFTVEEVGEYPQDAFPTNRVYGKINYAGLRLITCGGTFDYATRHYSDNIVVYAKLTP